MPGADALLALSAVELRRRIGTKEISPVELLEAAIGCIEAVNPAVNAIAAAAYGLPLHRGFVAGARDAGMVALVREAGAIVVAKTNVPEFGAVGNTCNPVWGATGTPSTRR